MRTALACILAILAASPAAAAETNSLPEDAELTAASTRFALTATNDPSYNEALAAYCRLILKRIEGLPKDKLSRAVDRKEFGCGDFVEGPAFALVGRGYWSFPHFFEIHVLDDHPLWYVGGQEQLRLCGRGVFVGRPPARTTPAVTLAGLSLADLEAAAAGRGLPERHDHEPEFPPITSELRESDLPFQCDAWVPKENFDQNETVPLYMVLRNRMGAPFGIEGWLGVYVESEERFISGQLGPDGQDAVALGLYRIEDAGRVRVIGRWPWDGACFITGPNPYVPPKGGIVYVTLLNGAYDVSKPGEYELCVTYPSAALIPRVQPGMFHGYIPAPPIRFRVVPPWYVSWGPRALIAAAVAALLLVGWFLARRRHPGSTAAEPPPAART